MKRFFFITAVFAAGYVCSVRAQERLVDRIDAVVNEAPITQMEVEKFTEQDERDFYRDLHDKPDLLEKRVVDLRLNTTEFLINRAVILNDSKESMKVPESILEEFVNDRLKETEKKYPDHQWRDAQRKFLPEDQLVKQIECRHQEADGGGDESGEGH